MLTFWYKLAGKSKGKMLEFFATPLSRMPIFIANEEKQKILAEKVEKIISIKRIVQRFKELWRITSEQYRNGVISLQKLVLNDVAEIQNGKFDHIWILNISGFPDSNDSILIEDSESFLFKLENDTKLHIFSVNQTKEKLILTLKAKNKDFRDILYLELCKLFDSRKKIKNLKDIISKTEISVIKPNIWEKSHNLIKYTIKQLEDEFKISSFDIAEAENELKNLENEVDSGIFKLYDINLEEVKEILNSLNTINSTSDSIIALFQKIK